MIILSGEEYDSFAHAFVVQRASQEKLAEDLSKSNITAKAELTRLELYIKNVYYPKFNSNLHSFSVNEDDKYLIIYPKKEFIRVNSLYEEKEASEDSLLEQFKSTNSFEEMLNKQLESNNKIKDFFEQNIKKVLAKIQLSNHNLNNLLVLIDKHSDALEISHKVHTTMHTLETDFTDIIDAALNCIMEDERYEDLDIENYQLDVIKDKNNISRLVLIPLDELDEEEDNYMTGEEFLKSFEDI